jgi:murein DD-endopeptidase MepM/ murein hydrolase activator NlpD
MVEFDPRPRRGWVEVRRTTLILGGVLFVVTFVGFAHFFRQAMVNADLVERHQRLLAERMERIEKLGRLQNELNLLEEKVQRLEDYRAEVAGLVGFADSDFGLGGYLPRRPSGKVSRVLERKEEELLRDLWLRLRQLEVGAEKQGKVAEAYLEFLETKRDLVEAIPDIRPVRNAFLASPFGVRQSPFGEGVSFHRGVDLGQALNSPVFATAHGTVVQAGWHGGYGKSIRIDHGFGFSTFYAHLNRIDVAEGDEVSKGQVIGLLGNTGRSTGPHVHYEVFLEGRAVNPYYFMRKGE